MRPATLVTVCAVVLALTGCTTVGPDAEPLPPATPVATATPTAIAAPADGGTFATVEALRDTYVEAGGRCDEWDQSNIVTAAAESADCDADTVLSTYTSVADRDGIVNYLKEYGEGIGGVTLLVGGNWIINSEDAREVQPGLGGIVVTT